MGLTRAGMSCRRYRVADDWSGGRARILEQLREHAFRDLGQTEAGPRDGWVEYGNLLDRDFLDEHVFIGPIACFALRIDQRRLPARLVNAMVERELRELMQSEGRTKPKAGERVEVKEGIEARLLAKCIPTPRVMEVAWDQPAGTVFFYSTSNKSEQILRALFFQTFGLRLFPTTPARLTAEDVEAELLYPALDALAYSLDPAEIH